MIQILVAVLVAALAYAIIVAVGAPAILGLVAAILILIVGIAGGGSLRYPR